MSFSRILYLFSAGAISVLTVLLISTTPLAVQAATITVDTTTDEVNAAGNGCSLREAIIAINAGANGNQCVAAGDAYGTNDTIDFSVQGTFTLSIAGTGEDAAATGDLDITADLVINGDGATQTIIDANGIDRVFHADGATVTFNQISIQGGSVVGTGGGIFFSGVGPYTISDSTISGNSASIGGGGIYYATLLGELTISDTTISGNTEQGSSGGGLVHAGSTSVLNVYNSTISGNQAVRFAGGILNDGTANLKNVTISNNTADSDGNDDGEGGGIYNFAGTITLINSIVAGNSDDTAAGTVAPDCNGTITSNGYNILGDNSNCTFNSTTGDQVGTGAAPVDAKLDTLASNGGSTQTQAPLPTSPAIDAGIDTACSDPDVNGGDQRGETRCVDADGDGSTIDIGAYEVQAFTVDSTSDVTDANVGDEACDDGAGNCTLRAAIQETNALSGTDAIIVPAGTYALSIAGTLEDLSAAGDLDITDHLMMTGAGASSTTIDGEAIDRVFDIDPNQTAEDVLIDGVTITDGDAGIAADGGGVRKKGSGTLTIQNAVVTANDARVGAGVSLDNGFGTILDSTISLNDSSSGGGGIHVTGDDALLVKRSAIINNTAAGGGGGISFTGTPDSFTIINSTISGNTATTGGGGILFGTNFAVVLRNVTISNNTADSDGSDGVNDNGGGIRRTGGGGTVSTIMNTIIAGNNDNSGGGGTVNPDCDIPGSVTSQDYNIIGDDTGCELTFTQTNDQVDTDPLLASLADNGGPTQTHALQNGSPAQDTGRPEASGGCVDENDDALTTDQRGFTRPVNSRCDMGAFEVGSCGDGIVDGGEECDNGAGTNSDATANACRTACVNFSCGDNVVDAGEACDDGNNTDGDGCQANCALASCGDGIVDSGEACDDGGSNSDSTADACRTTCVAASCADAVQDAGEACDDGNANNADGCTTSCVANIAGGLADINPNVDFNNLIVDQTVTLEAPDPTGGGSTLVMAQTAPADCTCTWSVDPAARGSFSDAASCPTDFTPQATGTGTMFLTVDCGPTGVGNYFQSISISDGTGTAGTGGGCSLIRR